MSWFKSSVCVAAVAVAQGVFAGATYDAVSQPGDLIVTVDADGATMEAAQVTEGVTNIIKRGEGTLTATPIASYAGDFTIEKGVYAFDNAGDFGAASGQVFVKDGASIRFLGTTASLLKGKRVHLFGDKAASASGKIERQNNSLTSLGTFSCVLEDSDAIYYSAKGRFCVDGVTDLRGHKLTLDGGQQMQFGGVITNGGQIVVTKYTTLMNESALTFAKSAGTAEVGTVELQDGAILNLKHASTVINGWNLIVKGGHLRGNFAAEPTSTGMPYWDGPITFSTDKSTVASYAGSASLQQTVYNIKGPVSGSGKIAVGPGWLNLFSSENAFSGAVTVVGGNANVPYGNGGIGVRNGANCFRSASSITFNTGSRFQLMDDVPAALPAFTFSGTYDQSFTGGSSVYSNRSTWAGFTKTSSTTLTVDSRVHVTGAADVQAGTLKIPFRSRFGNAGLHVTHLVAATTANNSSIAEATKPWSDLGEKVVKEDQGVDETGPTWTLQRSPAIVKGSDKYRHGYWYRGYLWNRSATNETWQILADNYPAVVVYLGDDRTKGLHFNNDGAAVFAKPQEVTLAPGPTEINIWAFTWSGNAVYPYHYEKKGLMYARYPNVAVENFTTNSPDLSAFSPMTDNGTGLLFTVDDLDSDVAGETDVRLPIFDDLRLAEGATLDLDGNLRFVLKNLSGLSTVSNAQLFAVTGTWSVAQADVAAGRRLTCDGTLRFADGATVAVTGTERLEVPVSREYVIATAKAVTGSPVIDPASPYAAKWEVKTTATEVKLCKKQCGLTLIFK